MFRTFLESALIGTLIVAICSLPACRTRSSGSAIQTSANAPSKDLPKLEDTAIWEHLDANNRSGLANMYGILQNGFDKDLFRLVDKNNNQVTLSQVLTTKLTTDDIKIISPNAAGGDVVSDVKIVTEGDTIRMSFVAMNSDLTEELGSQSISIDASGNGPSAAQQAVRAIEALKAFDAEVRYNLRSQASIMDTLFPKAYADKIHPVSFFCIIIAMVLAMVGIERIDKAHPANQNIMRAIVIGGTVTIAAVGIIIQVLSAMSKPTREIKEETDYDTWSGTYHSWESREGTHPRHEFYEDY